MENHEHNLHPERDRINHRVDVDIAESVEGGKKQNAKKRHCGGAGWGRIFLALVIITVGVLYLAANFSLIEDIGFTLWQLWPLLLIAAGLSLLSLSRIWSGLVGLVVTIAVIGLLFISAFGAPSVEMQTVQQNIAIDKILGIEDTIVVVQFGAGSLNIGAGDEFVAGFFESNIADLGITSRLEGDLTQRINISTEKIRPWNFGHHVNDLDLQIGQQIPIDLYIDAGAAQIDLDLRDIILKGLDIDAGASDIDIVVGEIQDHSKIVIDAGASDMHLTLPQGVGAELILESGISSKDLQGFVSVDSGHYLSNGYEDADVKIEILLDIAAANIVVDWVE